MRKSRKLWKLGMASALITGSVVAIAPGMAAAANEFPDVQKGSSPFEAVKSLTARGIIDGHLDGTYRPAANVTRGQAAKLIVEALDMDTENVQDPGFKDIPKTHRFYKYIAALANEGVINGYKDGRFGSDDPLMRSQMARILGDAYDFGAKPLTNREFTDIDPKAYYAPYLQVLIDKGITFGKTKTSFAPHAFVDRGQMAMFLYRSDKVKFGKYVKAGITKVENGTVFTSEGNFEVTGALEGLFSDKNAPALKNANIEFRVGGDKIVGIGQLQLNTSGTSTNPLILDGGNANVQGDVIVQGDNLNVQNLTVKGDFTVGDKVQYSFEGDNLKVKGKTIITDDAASTHTGALLKQASIVFSNSKLNKLYVSKKDVGVSLESGTTVDEFELSENAIIESDSKLGTVEIEGDVTEVEINSDIKKLEVETAERLTLNITGNVDKLELSADAKVVLNGDVQIGDLDLPKGVAPEDVIENYDAVKGNIKKINGDPNPDYDEPGGGGGGGGGGSTPPTGNKPLNDEIQEALEKAQENEEVTSKVEITLNGKNFNVLIKEDGTLEDFKAAAKPVFDAFKEAEVTVSYIAIYLTVDKQKVPIAAENIDSGNDLDFEGVISRALAKLPVSKDTALEALKGKTLDITIKGEIDEKDFNDTYKFSFE